MLPAQRDGHPIAPCPGNHKGRCAFALDGNEGGRGVWVCVLALAALRPPIARGRDSPANARRLARRAAAS